MNVSLSKGLAALNEKINTLHNKFTSSTFYTGKTTKLNLENFIKVNYLALAAFSITNNPILGFAGLAVGLAVKKIAPLTPELKKTANILGKIWNDHSIKEMTVVPLIGLSAFVSPIFLLPFTLVAGVYLGSTPAKNENAIAAKVKDNIV